jgi:hypothetical protein
MDVKHGLLYLGSRGMRIRNGEGFAMRNFIICIVHLIVRVITSRKLRYAGYVARMEESRTAF